MPQVVQVRDLDDDVHRILRVRAAQHGLSLAQYLRRELSALARRPSMAEFLERAAAAASSPVSTAEVVALVRSDRDDRLRSL